MARTKIYVPRETAAVSVGADEVALAIAQVAKKTGVEIELIRTLTRSDRKQRAS